MSIGVLSDELENDNDEREHNTIDAEWTQRIFLAEIFHYEMNGDEARHEGDNICEREH